MQSSWQISEEELAHIRIHNSQQRLRKLQERRLLFFYYEKNCCNFHRTCELVEKGRSSFPFARDLLVKEVLEILRGNHQYCHSVQKWWNSSARTETGSRCQINCLWRNQNPKGYTTFYEIVAIRRHEQYTPILHSLELPHWRVFWKGHTEGLWIFHCWKDEQDQLHFLWNYLQR